MLKKVLQAEGKWCQMETLIYPKEKKNTRNRNYVDKYIVSFPYYLNPFKIELK
jgi:hypothetical protein